MYYFFTRVVMYIDIEKRSLSFSLLWYSFLSYHPALIWKHDDEIMKKSVMMHIERRFGSSALRAMSHQKALRVSSLFTFVTNVLWHHRWMLPQICCAVAMASFTYSVAYIASRSLLFVFRDFYDSQFITTVLHRPWSNLYLQLTTYTLFPQAVSCFECSTFVPPIRHRKVCQLQYYCAPPPAAPVIPDILFLSHLLRTIIYVSGCSFRLSSAVYVLPLTHSLTDFVMFICVTEEKRTAQGIRQRLWELLAPAGLTEDSGSSPWLHAYRRLLQEEGTDEETQRKALLMQLWATQVSQTAEETFCVCKAGISVADQL